MTKTTYFFAFVSACLLNQIALAPGANATERLPLEVVACEAQGLVSWSYARPNGHGDHQAYLESSFQPEYGSDDSGWVRVRTAIPGLAWDQNFKHVVYTAADGKATTCAKKNWMGITPFRGNCYPSGQVALTPGAHSACHGRGAAVLSGEFVIAD